MIFPHFGDCSVTSMTINNIGIYRLFTISLLHLRIAAQNLSTCLSDIFLPGDQPLFLVHAVCNIYLRLNLKAERVFLHC